MAEKKQIFIVEDNLEVSAMLTTYFRSQSFNVRATGYGEEAIQLIAEEVPDLVLMDINLHDIDGYEVCRRLRNNRHTQHLPIIFLTEKREKNYRLAGLELGAEDYITKPFDMSELHLRVRNALRRSELESRQNPITGLPAGIAVQERLSSLVNEKNWQLAAIKIHGMDRFREMYGFVAADDITRAVSLMIANAMQEVGIGDQFIGHIDASYFVVVTSAPTCPKLVEQCRIRLEPSVTYFYPAMDRNRLDQIPDNERLGFQITCLDNKDYQFSSMDALQDTLTELFD